MPLSNGDQLGPYEILSPLGAGGMGEVFRARDTKLGREVAIKVLPDLVAADPVRLARFQREAQLLAGLNHPNIATIFGVEDRALVMELVEGNSPAGPMSADEVLPLVHQFIDALEYAHDKGVVHRDLKPANLKVTPDGRLKVLDFGLAKAITPDAPGPVGDPSSSPTLTMRATMAGVIMGTAAYMAPEQARGQNVDKRADIWSFAVVLHELLTGKLLFEGGTVTDVLASVLRQDLDLAPVPQPFRRLLAACLERDPRRRMRDIGDARLLLSDRFNQEEPAALPAGTSTPWKIGAAIAALAAIVLAVFLYRATRPVERPLLRFNTELSPDAMGANLMTAVISPDGNRIAFRVRAPGGYMLGTRQLDQSQATVIPGSEHIVFAFFSPDSQWLGFIANNQMKKVAVQGGTPVTICDTPNSHGAVWLKDGTIVASIKEFILVRVPAAGGVPQVISDVTTNRRFPQALPDENEILVTESPLGSLNSDTANIDVFSLKNGTQKTVLRGGYFGRYVPTGHLLYVHQGILFAIRFNLDKLETVGSAVPVLDDLAGSPGTGAGHFDFSASGTLVYQNGKPLIREQPLAVLDADGKQKPLAGAAGDSLRLSPDGKRLAFSAAGDISIYNLQTETPTRLTFDPPANHRLATWTPDGKYIAYVNNSGIWWTRSDGSGQPQQLLAGDPPPAPWSFTAGENAHRLRLAFHGIGQDKSRDIFILPLDITDPDHPVPGKPELFLGTSAAETAPSFSPDGRWMAYSVSGTGVTQVFVRRYRPGAPAEGGKWQIADAAGGNLPVWGVNGKQLFYRSDNGHIRVVDYTTSGDTFAAGRAREWSPTPIYITGVFEDYDIFPDAKRAVVVSLSDKYKGGLVAQHAVFLFNFFDELKRRLP